MSEHRAQAVNAADLELLSTDPAAFFAVTPPPSSTSPIRAWLAEKIRAAKADAWDEGHDAATDEAPDGVWPDAWIDAHNPYRNGEGRHVDQ